MSSRKPEYLQDHPYDALRNNILICVTGTMDVQERSPWIFEPKEEERGEIEEAEIKGERRVTFRYVCWSDRYTILLLQGVRSDTRVRL